MITDNLNLLFKLKTDLETKLFQSFYNEQSPLFDRMTYERVTIDIKTKLIPLVGFNVIFTLAFTKINHTRESLITELNFNQQELIRVIFNSSDIDINKGFFVIEFRDITTRDSFRGKVLYSFKEKDSEIEKAVNDICQFLAIQCIK